jgi:hypothetical protein
VRIFQIFRIWLVPFYYAPVNFTTVLVLKHNRSDGKYYIQSQDDLYQIEEWVKFLVPGSWVLVLAWQFLATVFCWMGTVALAPVTWVEEWWGWGRGDDKALERQRIVREWRWLDGRSEEEVLRTTDVKGRIVG